MSVRNKAWAAAAALSAALGVVSATAPQASAGTITVPYQTGYQLAYNSGNGSVMGDLCVWPNSSGVLGGCNPSTLGPAIMPGTSPAITSLHGKGYGMAYQTSAGTLAVAGKQANGDLGLAMMPGTSPSITDLSDGGYEIAFQSNTGALWVTGTAGNTAPVGVAMDPTSSPSITDAGNPGYEIAYQDAYEQRVLGRVVDAVAVLGVRAVIRGGHRCPINSQLIRSRPAFQVATGDYSQSARAAMVTVAFPVGTNRWWR